jgi:GT2 family glycosyltransferase
MKEPVPLPVADSCLDELELSLWSGPVSDTGAVERALRWEREVLALEPGPAIGLVFSFGAAEARAVRCLLATLAGLGPAAPVRAAIRFPEGAPSDGLLDPRKAGAVRGLPEILEAFGLAGRVSVFEDADAEQIFPALAGESDFIGVCAPGHWLQPRGFFALSRFAARLGPGMVIAGAIRFDPESGKRAEVRRVPASPRYGALGANVFGPCPLFRSDRLGPVAGALGELDRDWLSRWWAPWAFGLAGLCACDGSTRARLPLLPWATFGSGVPDGDAEAADSGFARFARHRAEDLGADLAEWRLEKGGASPRARVVPAKGRGGSVGVLLPFRDEEESTGRTLASLARQVGAGRLFPVLIDNGSAAGVLDRLRETAERLFGEGKVAAIRVEEPFNFARLNNRGVAALPDECETLVFANNDIEFGGPGVLGDLCALLSWPAVGLAGGTLYYPDGEVQAAGFRVGPAGPQAVREPGEGVGSFREVDGVGFALAVCRREAFEAVGGLDERRCPNGFGDALFCHRLRREGWRILCLPEATVWHYESKSRGIRPEEFEYHDMTEEGIPAGLFFEDFATENGVRDETLVRPRPTLAKRFYRAGRAFLRAWRAGGGR